MKIYFSPAEQKIVDVLRDMEWHCVYNAILMKDDRARLTTIHRKLQEKGYGIESKPCDGRCGHSHHSRIVMRRIVKTPSNSPKTPPTSDESPTVEEMLKDAKKAVLEFDSA